MPILKKPSISGILIRKKVIQLTNPKDSFGKITFYHYGKDCANPVMTTSKLVA